MMSHSRPPWQNGPRSGVVCQGRCDDSRSGAGDWFWMFRSVSTGSAYQLAVINPRLGLAGMANCEAGPDDDFNSLLARTLALEGPPAVSVTRVKVQRPGWPFWAYCFGGSGDLFVGISILGRREHAVALRKYTGSLAGIVMHGFMDDAMGIPPVDKDLFRDLVFLDPNFKAPRR